MEINTPIALVCYERALRLPTSSPSKHNQLSDLTYLPEACKTHGTGLAVVQKVPIYKNFGPRQIFWASGFLLWVDTDWRCWCDVCMVHSAPPCLLPRPSFAVCSPLSTHRHTHTPLHLLVLSCTQTKERKRDQRKIKWPARVLMREGRASGIYLKPFLPPAAALWRALSPPPVNGWSVDFLSNKG